MVGERDRERKREREWLGASGKVEGGVEGRKGTNICGGGSSNANETNNKTKRDSSVAP